MNFSKPVIAAIVTGGISVVTLVVLLILYLTGFFEPDEVVTMEKTSRDEYDLWEEINTAADDILPLFGEDRSKFENLIKTLSFETKAKCEELEKWIRKELKIKEENVETVLNYVCLSFQYLLKKAKACERDPDAFKKVQSVFSPFYKFFSLLSNYFSNKYSSCYDALELGNESVPVQEIANKYKEIDPKVLGMCKKMLKIFILQWSNALLCETQNAVTVKIANLYVSRCTELLSLI